MASPVAHSIHYHVASPVTVQALGLDNQNPAVGQTVRAGAKIVAEQNQKFDAVVFAVRDDAGHHADFPLTKNWKQGTHQRVYQASRAFNTAGDYTYWFAYEKDGHWTDLAPKQKFTVKQPGSGGGTPAPAPTSSDSPASPSPSPSDSTAASPAPGKSSPTAPGTSAPTTAPSPSAPARTPGTSAPARTPGSSAPAPSPSRAAGPSTSAPAPRPAPSTAPPTTAAPSPTASPTPSGAASGRDQSAYVTFYAARDNDPAGSTAIAYPGLHKQAGGTGTFADPITFATSRSELAPGTKIYVPKLHKYFVMEDDCAECDSDWSQQKWHVDLYMGSSTQSGVVTCENQMTQDGGVTIVINPDANRPVDTHALYSDSSGCYKTTY